MPKKITPLTDTKIKNSKPKKNVYNLSDGNGLFLRIKPAGGKTWIFDYTKPITKKRSQLGLGSYPTVSLLEARAKRDEYKKLLITNTDPKEYKNELELKAVYENRNTFKEWATRLLESKSELTEKSIRGIESKLRNHIYPRFANHNINEVKRTEIVNLLKEIEERGNIETAKRCKNVMSQVFRYAMINEACSNDPTHAISGILKQSKPKHMPTLTNRKDIAKLMHDIDLYTGTFTIKQALRLAPHLMLRPNEIRFAKWEYIDFEEKLWTIPAEMMKMRYKHIVPLSIQVIELLKELYNVNSNSPFLFPHISKRTRTMSENSINQALHTIGYKDKMVAHGFRSMASTVLHEKGFNSLIIEKQLAHNDKNQIRASYNHADYLEERRKMMQWWSNFLER